MFTVERDMTLREVLEPYVLVKLARKVGEHRAVIGKWYREETKPSAEQIVALAPHVSLDVGTLTEIVASSPLKHKKQP